jgi:DNA repair protein RecO (recombination protein O)
MQWTDEGIVIGVKRHGEASGILELMTREHGRHLGRVRGGFGSRLKPVLQTGNSARRTSLRPRMRSMASPIWPR